MEPRNKPAFATWKMENLVKLAGELYDQSIQLRQENEQLRLDLKSAAKTIEDLQNKDDWK